MSPGGLARLVLLAAALRGASPCYPPQDFVYKSLPELAQSGDAVVGGVHEQMTPVVNVSGQFRAMSLVVNSTLRVTDVYKLPAGVACMPRVLLLSPVVVVDPCIDIRRHWIAGRKYVVILSRRPDGGYSPLNSLQLSFYEFNDENERLAAEIGGPRLPVCSS